MADESAERLNDALSVRYGAGQVGREVDLYSVPAPPRRNAVLAASTRAATSAALRGDRQRCWPERSISVPSTLKCSSDNGPRRAASPHYLVEQGSLGPVLQQTPAVLW